MAFQHADVLADLSFPDGQFDAVFVGDMWLPACSPSCVASHQRRGTHRHRVHRRAATPDYSWLARDASRIMAYTLAHVVRFKMKKLRAYEQILRTDPDCQIAWQSLDPAGGKLDQPQRIELLQLADAAASATATAFEVDRFGNTEERYLCEFTPRLYRRGNGKLTSYGLKMHSWSDTTRAAYPWVTAL